MRPRALNEVGRVEVKDPLWKDRVDIRNALLDVKDQVFCAVCSLTTPDYDRTHQNLMQKLGET